MTFVLKKYKLYNIYFCMYAYMCVYAYDKGQRLIPGIFLSIVLPLCTCVMGVLFMYMCMCVLGDQIRSLDFCSITLSYSFKHDLLLNLKFAISARLANSELSVSITANLLPCPYHHAGIGGIHNLAHIFLHEC